MPYRIGSGYLGSSQIKTTTSPNTEIIPDTPAGWSFPKYQFYKFSFFNYQPCTVKINNGEPIYLQAEQGFQSDYMDAPIFSFVIQEAGVQYQWIGAY